MGIAPRGVSIMELYRWYRENKLLGICIAHFKQSSLTSNFLSSS